MTAEGTLRALVLLFVSSACGNDPEKLYSDDPALPHVPFLPDEERRDDCEACAKASCSEERDACIAELACAELLACRGICSDPACLAQCGERTDWGSDIGLPQNELFDAFEGCVVTRACGSQCGWGQNWECRGHYVWPSPEDGSISIALEVRAGPSNAPQIAHVTACSAPGCTQPIDEADTDGWGQAWLSVSARAQPAFLRFDFGDQLVDLYAAPIFRETRIVFLPPVKLYPEYVSLGGPELLPFASPESTILGLQILDCAGAPAPGVRYELAGDDRSRSFYSAGLPVPSFLATETDGSGSGGFLGVAAGEAAIRAWGLGEQRLASMNVPVEAEQTTVVVLFPDTTPR